MKKLLVFLDSDHGTFRAIDIWAIYEEMKLCRILLFAGGSADEMWCGHLGGYYSWRPLGDLYSYLPNFHPENYFIEVNEFPKTLEELKEIAMEVFL